MIRKYQVLNRYVFSQDEFSIIPIREQDKFKIMKWRNEQIYHLRQEKLLTESDQIFYFDNIVSKLFSEENPKQLLFSYMEASCCIGYGGLVHINWNDKNAEISFIMDTSLEKDSFVFNWLIYLSLIEKVAFEELDLHKIFVYAFDLRPQLYHALEQSGFFRDAELKEHCLYNGVFIDVVIYSKLKHIVMV